MNLAFMLSSVALGISVVVSAIKFLDWWLHTDPRTMIRTGRWILYFLAVAAVPTLVLLIVYEMWVPAMLLGAAMLIVPVALNWRRLSAMRPAPRSGFRPAWTDGPPPDRPFGGAPSGRFDDAAIAARAAEVLEAYLDHVKALEAPPRATAERSAESAAGGRMSRREALEVLGLDDTADAAAVRAAHRRLIQLIHPDRGGTDYLTAKINEAKDTLAPPKRAAAKAAAAKTGPAKPRKPASRGGSGAEAAPD